MFCLFVFVVGLFPIILFRLFSLQVREGHCLRRCVPNCMTPWVMQVLEPNGAKILELAWEMQLYFPAGLVSCLRGG